MAEKIFDFQKQRWVIYLTISLVVLGGVVGFLYTRWQQKKTTFSYLLYINLDKSESLDSTSQFYARSQSKDVAENLTTLLSSREFVTEVKKSANNQGLDLTSLAVRRVSPQLIRVSMTGTDRGAVSSSLEDFYRGAVTELHSLDKNLDEAKIHLVSDKPLETNSADRLLVNVVVGILTGAVVAGVLVALKGYF